MNKAIDAATQPAPTLFFVGIDVPEYAPVLRTMAVEPTGEYVPDAVAALGSFDIVRGSVDR